MAQAVIPVAKFAISVIGSSLVKKIAVNVAISAGLSFLRSVITPKQKAVGAGARLLNAEDYNNLGVASISDRQGVYGETGLAGEIMFAHLHADRRWVSYVIQLADSGQVVPHEFIGLTVDGVGVSFDGSGNAIGTFAGFMKLRFYGGTPTQTADSQLISDSAGRWTENHRGRGLCYVVWTLLLADEEKFPNGRPDPIFRIRGRALYDPRLDSTKPGGDGPHRIDDESTWEWSNNAALVIYDYARGVMMGEESRRVGGLGLPARLIDEDWVVASANASDDEGWTIDGPFAMTADPVENLASFGEHMGGRVATVRGRIAPIAGYRWPDVLEIGPDDLAGPLDITSNREWREAVNSVRGSYREPLQGWEIIETEAVEVAAWVAEDRGQVFELPKQFPFKFVYDDVLKAGRVALYRERTPRTISAPFKIRCAKAQEGDMVTVALPQYGISERYEVETRSLDATGFVTLALRQYDPDEALDFSGGAEPPTVERIDRPPITPAEPSGWAAVGATIGGDGGSMPGIRVYGTVPGYVHGALVEYRLAVGPGPWVVWGDIPRDTGETIIAGLAPDTAYEVRVRYRRGTTMGTAATFSVTTPNVYTSISALTLGGRTASEVIADIDESLAEVGRLANLALSALARGDLTRANLARLGYVNGIPLGTTLATMTSERIEGDALIVETLDLIGAKSVDGTSFILDADTVRVSPSETLATRLSTIEAEADSNAAAITSETSARITADGVIASSVTALTTTVSGHTATLTAYGASIGGIEARYGVRLDVNGRVTGFETNAGAGGSNFIVVADRFAFVDPGNTAGAESIPFEYSSGVLRIKKAHIKEVDIGGAGGTFSVAVDGTVTIRNATSGARLEISNSLVRVYDASNVLRVRLGLW